MRLSLPLRLLAALAALPALLSLPQNDEEIGERPAPGLPQLVDQWRAVHGQAWRYHVDWQTGHLEMLYGGSASPAFQAHGEADWERLARRFLEETREMHGVAAASLEHDRSVYLPLGQAGSTDKLTVRFRQVVGAVPVVGGHVNVLMDASSGALLSIQSTAMPRLDGAPAIPSFTASSATAAAERQFEERVGVLPTSVGAPELVFVQVVEADLRSAVLAWQLDLRWEAPDAEPEAWRYWVDAKSGELVRAEGQVHHFDVGGTVRSNTTTTTLPDTGGNPELQVAMPYMDVSSSAGTVTTDANGNFNFPGVSGPLDCTFTYEGDFARVTNDAGGDYSLSTSLNGTGNAVLMNPSSTATVTAQSNAFNEIAVLRDWIRSVVPGDSTADFQALANCNLNSTCNAYYDGTSVNFFAAGGGCVNTSYTTVIAHEMGHWLNVLYGTGNGSDGIGEGNADVFAMYLYDEPIVGEDFCGNGCHIRTGLNTTQFCGDTNPGCHGGVHADGEVWMGAAWKVRRNLNTTHGNSAGDAIADLVFMSWMNAYDQTQIRSVMEDQWLALDDDDGNIGNGTPNYGDIDSAFREQGFPGVDLDAIVIGNVTQLPDTQDEAGPYVVQATITALVSPPLAGATLYWRVNGGSFLSQTMAPLTSELYEGAILGQQSPAVVEYYVEATDNAGVDETWPPNAPAELAEFKVGVLTVFLFNEFEGGTNEGWSEGAPGDDATTGTWERGDPDSTSAQPGDDHTPAPGVLCWFTGATGGGGLGDNDVDGGRTTLLSPAFDAGSLNDPEISYWRWYSNDQGASPNADVFEVDISNNGGSTWTNVETVGPTGPGTSGGWIQHSFRIADYVSPTADMRLRFVASDEGSGSIVEAAVDDVEGVDLGPVTFTDCNGNGVPDEDDISGGSSQDCNGNSVPDECDLSSGTSADCNGNSVPDECDIAGGTSDDCNGNGVPDDCDLSNGTSADCNANSIPDECDISGGTSGDCNANGTPDECEPDCNGNGVPDDCDLSNGTSADCNANSIPDECDISGGTSGDCNANGTPDECETDCNSNGVPDDCDLSNGTSADCNANSIPDECDIAGGTSADLNGNGIPDECETDCNGNGVPDDQDIANGTSADCNANSIPDECDISGGTSGDCNANGTPDECEPDCNGNGVPDDCDLSNGTSADCNANSIPDECDISGGTSGDCNANGTPDECETDCNSNGVPDDCDLSNGTSADCNANSIPDECDIAGGTSGDCNANGTPDECETDCNSNGVPDDCDLSNGTSADCNANSIPDECDIAGGTSADLNGNGIPDECETDCNGNGVPDDQDIANGTSADCNANSIPDECDISGGTSGDCNANGTPDECEPDCNGNGVPDDCDLSNGTSADCNANSIPDECDISGGTSGDCNANGTPDECEPDCNGNGVPDDCDLSNGTSADCNANSIPDECDISGGTSGDCNANGTPDECEPDCNGNGVPDDCDLSNGTSADCNANSIPDECDISGGTSGDCNANGTPDECEPDCNGNGVPDDCDLSNGTSADCNANSIPDECDISGGTSGDCNANGTPDECEPDCNGNGVPDDCDLSNGTSADCNANSIPDECDISGGTSGDCNANGTPDECEPDCNGNGVPDDCDLSNGTSADCNANSIPDECDISGGTSGDCNANGTPDECEPDCNGNGVPDDCDLSNGTSADCNANSIPDECDISGGTSGDCNANGTPDECEPDCNGNGVPDDCDLSNGTSADCNANSIPDECDISGGTSGDCNANGTPDECEPDCNGNGVPDDCDLSNGTSADCNANSIPDECDISGGTSGDCNANGTPDECEPDCNGNGVPDDCDLSNGTSADCNANSIPDECDIAGGTSDDANGNGVPDECECSIATYCVAAPNSVGLGALMGWSGSASVAQNDLVLEVDGLPLNQFGIFYYGPNQIQIPFGNGFRCVGGGVYRLPVISTGSQGQTSWALDITDPPLPGGQISSGDTWNFQFWYRDPAAGGLNFNFSDALSILFCD